MSQPNTSWLARLLFGEPLATEESDGQRVGPLTGVPILGLDALASAAYGPEAFPSGGAASGWLLLRAFANGCTAMTGVEAVSNGVSIFREPAAVGAKRTSSIIICLLVLLLLGISYGCVSRGITATPPGTPLRRLWSWRHRDRAPAARP